MSQAEIESIFPLITSEGYQVQSPETFRYNCIAWAIGDTNRPWWPAAFAPGVYYWPPGIRREETVESFTYAFRSVGYEPCDSAVLEVGYEKVALYVSNTDIPTHAARQLDSGAWTSKLGDLEDVEHPSLRALEASDYGVATYFFRRSRDVPPA